MYIFTSSFFVVGFQLGAGELNKVALIHMPNWMAKSSEASTIRKELLATEESWLWKR